MLENLFFHSELFSKFNFLWFLRKDKSRPIIGEMMSFLMQIFKIKLSYSTKNLKALQQFVVMQIHHHKD